MAQLAPTTMQYYQMLVLIEQFKEDYAAGEFKTPDEVAEKVNSLLTEFNSTAGEPTMVYDPVHLGEPPLSQKMNRFWSALENDINIAQEELNIIRASTIFLHNFIATEVQLARNENAKALNKLKTLQLYSSAHDANIIQFGDYFTNEDFIDNSLIPADKKVSILSAGNVALGKESDVKNFSTTAKLSILPESNGFSGNNQEIIDPATALINPTDNTPVYVFKAETNPRSDLNAVLDGEPNTWFEYEHNLVSPQDRLAAKNFNFSYRNTEYVPEANDVDGGSESANSDLIDWANGPANGILKLNLEFDLKAVKSINHVAYTPFGLEGNINHPIRVVQVQTSSDGTEWLPVSPENVYITTDANLNSARASENVAVGSAVWNFPERSVRYIRMNLEQNRPVDSKIGHLFFESRKIVTRQTEMVSDPANPGQLIPKTTDVVTGGERVEGPHPPLNDPGKYYRRSGLLNGLVLKNEYFNGKRWVIGIRDIVIQEAKFKKSSFLVSKPFKINGIIDRVALDADVYIPEEFDSQELWVRFFVSPDNGLNWFPISRVQDDFIGVPEIIAFNDPLPSEFRELGVDYRNVPGTVNSLRLKVELSRPAEMTSSSPILRSYKLKIRKR